MEKTADIQQQHLEAIKKIECRIIKEVHNGKELDVIEFRGEDSAASACTTITIEAMRKAFDESRNTDFDDNTKIGVGYKYPTFEDYLKSLSPNPLNQ